MRENIGDSYDYPYCEECQMKDCLCPVCKNAMLNLQINRLDNGEFKK